MKEDANNLKEGQKGIKKDLKALKEHVSELDPKNADRHLEIKN